MHWGFHGDLCVKGECFQCNLSPYPPGSLGRAMDLPTRPPMLDGLVWGSVDTRAYLPGAEFRSPVNTVPT